MNCPKCGANTQPESKFCPQCGHNLKQEKGAGEGTAHHRKMPGWIKLLALVAIVIAIGIASFVYFANDFSKTEDTQSSRIKDNKLTDAFVKEDRLQVKKQKISAKQEDIYKPIEAQLKELKSHNITKAFHGLVSKDFEAETSYEQFRQYVESYPILTHYTKYVFKDHSIEDEIGNVTVILNPDKEAIPLEYKLIDEEGSWKIWSIRIVLPPADTKTAANDNDPLLLIDPVRVHIQALESKDVKKAYEDPIAKEFRDATSFADFEKFLKKFPVLMHHKSVSLLKPSIEKGVGTIQVEFEDDKGTTLTEYALVRQGDAWKIIGLRLLQVPSTAPVQQTQTDSSPSNKSDGKQNAGEFDPQPLLEVIQKQLEALKNNNIAKAYEEYTSKEFKSSTSLKQFEDFVNTYEVFAKNAKSSFDKLMFNNNIGTYSGTFTDPNNRVFTFEYDLIQEGGKWKILHIQLTPVKSDTVPAKPDPAKPMTFSKIALGTETDLKGIVANPTTTFKHDAGDLYLNIHVANGALGTNVEVTFKHLDSGSNIPPISTTLPDNGSSIISFVFSPPSKGWPKGNYQLDIKASSGESTTYDFNVD
jgi:hypothetical protein